AQLQASVEALRELWAEVVELAGELYRPPFQLSSGHGPTPGGRPGGPAGGRPVPDEGGATPCSKGGSRHDLGPAIWAPAGVADLSGGHRGQHLRERSPPVFALHPLLGGADLPISLGLHPGPGGLPAGPLRGRLRSAAHRPGRDHLPLPLPYPEDPRPGAGRLLLWGALLGAVRQLAGSRHPSLLGPGRLRDPDGPPRGEPAGRAGRGQGPAPEPGDGPGAVIRWGPWRSGACAWCPRPRSWSGLS